MYSCPSFVLHARLPFLFKSFLKCLGASPTLEPLCSRRAGMFSLWLFFLYWRGDPARVLFSFSDFLSFPFCWLAGRQSPTLDRATGAPTKGTVSEQHPELHNLVLEMAPKKAKKRSDSNVFSMFEQAQIQEFKEAFTIMDQNRDGFIDKADLRDTFAALGRLNVKNEELDDMIKEAPGPINFTVFLSMFGEKLKGADPEETILSAFKVFDPESKGLKASYIKEMLMTQGERFSKEEVDQMFAAFPPDVTGNLDYKNLVHIITHGEEKD